MNNCTHALSICNKFECDRKSRHTRTKHTNKTTAEQKLEAIRTKVGMKTCTKTLGSII